MPIKLRLSKHAQDKLPFSGINEDMIKEVLDKPQHEFYDIAKGVDVAIKELKFHGEEIGLVVIFTREDNTRFIVTTYPAREYNLEIRRKVKSGRWIRRTTGQR